MKKLIQYLFCYLGFITQPNVYSQNIEIVCNTNQIRIGEAFELQVKINFENGQLITGINWPQFTDTFTNSSITYLGESKVRNQSPKDEITGPSVTKYYRLTSFQPGNVSISPYSVYLASGDSLVSNMAFIKVLPVEIDTSKGIVDIKNIYIPTYNFNDYVNLTLIWLKNNWYVPTILLATLIYLFYRRIKRKNELKKQLEKPVVLIPPHIEAIQRLEKLRGEGLLEKGLNKLFYIELSDIIRNYIERRFNVPALEQTTEEILHFLRLSDLEKNNREQLSFILYLADLVKFAKHQPAQQENSIAFEKAYEFIEKTKEELKQNSEQNPKN